jgi:hypothetical protein
MASGNGHDTVEVGKRCQLCHRVLAGGAVKVPGVVSFTYDGQTWEVPPLNFRGVKWAKKEKIWDTLDRLRSESPEVLFDDETFMDCCTKVVHTALRRNYPDLTEEDVEEMIDLGNMMRLILATRGVDLGKLDVKQMAKDAGVSPTVAAMVATAEGTRPNA